MNWLVLVAIAVVFDSIRIFIDNYISDVHFKERGAVSQKLFYGLATPIIGLTILLVTRFNFLTADYSIVLLIVLSGILNALAGIPYYKALEIEDSTNIGIFIQLAPILYLILGWLFLGDTISPLQLVAFVIILAAPILILLTTRKRSRKIKLKAIFYAFCYVLIAVIGNLVFVAASESAFDFIDELGILFIANGLTNVAIVCARPKWRKRFFTVIKSNRHRVIFPMFINLIVGIIKNFAYRGALIAAPAVALASAASDSAEPILIFFMGLVLTLIWPKFGREKLNRKTVLVHLIATALVVTGVILLQF